MYTEAYLVTIYKTIYIFVFTQLCKKKKLYNKRYFLLHIIILFCIPISYSYEVNANMVKNQLMFFHVSLKFSEGGS